VFSRPECVQVWRVTRQWDLSQTYKCRARCCRVQWVYGTRCVAIELEVPRPRDEVDADTYASHVWLCYPSCVLGKWEFLWQHTVVMTDMSIAVCWERNRPRKTIDRAIRAFKDKMSLFSYCRNLVDPASSHMLVSKIKPCMSKYKHLYCETANGSLNQL
jgi:hypothetical protein